MMEQKDSCLGENQVLVTTVPFVPRQIIRPLMSVGLSGLLRKGVGLDSVLFQ